MAERDPAPPDAGGGVRRLVVGTRETAPEAALLSEERRFAAIEGAASAADDGPAAAVVTGRLPTIAPSPAGPPVDAATDESRLGTEDAAPTEVILPALSRNAMAFSAPPDAPLLAIILVPDADAEAGELPARRQLAPAVLPLTMALDPTEPASADAARRLRGEGREVVLFGAGLPADPSARDVEISVAASLAALPGAVALMEDAPRTLSGDPGLAAQVEELLARSGHGLLLRQADPRSATGAPGAVPRATVFRTLDADAGQAEAGAVARALDRAAFEARRSGTAVVIARDRPGTLQAIATWTEAEHGVRLAPLSAILLRQPIAAAQP